MIPPSLAGRIEGLNAWRAILMMVGVLLHASLWLPHQPLFAAIDLCSQSFRMGCFFVISGMLAGFSLRARSVSGWLRRRFFQIGLPTLFGLGVICPLMTMLLHAMPQATLRFPPVWLDWYHCWFLVALLVYASAIAAAEAVERRIGWIVRVDARVAAVREPIQLAVLLWLAVLVFALMAVTSAAVGALVPADHQHTAGQLRFMIGYLPVYAFGYLLARAPAFARAMLASAWSPSLLLALVALAYIRQFWAIPMLGGETTPMGDLMVRSGGAALSPVAAAILILRSAIAMRRVPSILDKLCDASFTIYLVHLPLVAVLTLAIAPLGWSTYASYVAIALGTAAGGTLFHMGAVRRWVPLSLLLNGRRPARIGPEPTTLLPPEPVLAAT